MTFLFDRWADVRKRIDRYSRPLWFFDFDGTLVPIASHPRKVVLTADIRRLLRRLAERFPGRVGILSGRPLPQLRKLVGLSDLIYGGTHGFEIRAPGFQRYQPVGRQRLKAFIGLERELSLKSRTIRGLWIESKKWTFCIHYRDTPRTDWPQRLTPFLREVRYHAGRLGFKVQDGIKVLEVFSDSRWNKGQALRWLMKRVQAKEGFYVGDDATDETVFRMLGRSGISIRVGKFARSKAFYFLQRQSQMKPLLQRILAL